MQYKTILRLIGLLLLLYSFSMLPPLLINIIFAEAVWVPFIAPYLLCAVLGLVLWRSFRNHQHLLKIREGFLIVVIIWFSISAISVLPFLLFQDLHLNLTDIVFETVSGLTTTGAVVFSNLDQLPHAILYYRQQLQFIGGMGIVVLAVAIFPMLGMGGSQLFRVETSGNLRDSKLTPRITQTAKALWGIYCLLTLSCAWCYWFCGMDWFYALGESFATVSTGGFSMHDNSFLYYHSRAVEVFACLFMLIGSINFALHYAAFQKRTFNLYFKDEESRFFFIAFLVMTLLCIATLFAHNHFAPNQAHWIDSVFMIISLSTTTGYNLAPFDNWESFTPILLVFASLIGGCAGSTTGGIKILRVMLIAKQIRREFVRLLHPQAVLPIKIDEKAMPEPALQSITGYVSLFFGLFAILILIFMALGNDFTSSFSAIAAGLANSGAGIGTISSNFASLSIASKWLLIITMLLGRLELYPLFILFTRPFWKA
ncbi:MAG: TrkH family potassium uptake protein [Gammaproteobacteria bacterium]